MAERTVLTYRGKRGSIQMPLSEWQAERRAHALAVLAVLRENTGRPVRGDVLADVQPRDEDGYVWVSLSEALNVIERDLGVRLRKPGFVRPCWMLP